MTMKFFGTILAGAALAMSVTSCNTDGDSTQTQNVEVLNITTTGNTQELEVGIAQFVVSTATDADQFALGMGDETWRFSILSVQWVRTVILGKRLRLLN